MNSNKYSFINPKKWPFFYGYVVLIFGSIGILFSIPGQTVGVSVFTDPVKDALGLTRNQFSNAYLIGTLLSAFFVTKAGRLFDKFGARYVAFFAASFLAISLIIFSYSEGISDTLKLFLNIKSWVIPFVLLSFLFFLVRFCGQGVLTMASRNMVMMWFDKNRGKVNSISSIAVSLGFSSSPILFNYLIDENGWEVSWQILAVSLFIFSFLILQFYRNKPEDFGLIPDGFLSKKKSKKKKVEILEVNFTLEEAKQTRAFWMFGLSLAFFSFFSTGFTFHVISIFKTQGYNKTDAIAVFLPISIIAISVSTLANILSDYIEHKIYLFIMIFSGIIAAVGLLLLDDSIGIYLLIIGLGVCSGLFAVVNAVTWPRYFGRKYLGAITGKIMSFLVIASALAPSFFSYCFTALGSYSYVSYILIPFLGFLFIGSLTLKKPHKIADK
ncbi:MFS transporter [Polaribacter sp. Z014]|uniref:MFS transporter n=1 Tax=Polaribacter sp. Z014 TaxID=2927126 RepID=UPI0020221258|nr:MFS transporter [Polaribacter sp. Z014]MCL7763810.1 MFS transporter [Polaribacter sp. Z014]